MPLYAYRCETCDTQREELHPMGEAPRFSACHACGFGTVLIIGAGVHIAPSALEGKGEAVRASNATEARWQQDMPAYKRMRNKGMQPKGVDGAARLEDKVGDQADIVYRKMLDQGVSRERIMEGQEEAHEIMATGVPL